jgi:Golgi apparatus protein 1
MKSTTFRLLGFLGTLVAVCTTFATAQSGPANIASIVGAANKDACGEDHKQYCGMKVGLALDLCMKKNYHKLSKKCLDAEFQHFMNESKSERANPLVKKKCASDTAKFCNDFKGDVILCLEKNLGALQKECRGIVELEQRIRRIDVRLNRALWGQCAADIAKSCGSLPNGRGAVWACLNNKKIRKGGPSISDDCRKVLAKENRMGSKNALSLPGINANCKSDLEKFCKGVKPGNGRTHACLRKSLERLSPGCKDAEFKQIVSESKDIRAKHNLSTACKMDLKNFCQIDLNGKEDIDSEKALKCLKDNLKGLSGPCKKAEFEELKLQGYSVRLNPWMKKACVRETEKFCKDLPPGKGTVLECLKSHVSDRSVSSECRKMLRKDIVLGAMFAGHNYKIRTKCRIDLKRFCGKNVEVKDASGNVVARGEGRDSLCLRQNFKKLTGTCRNAKLEELVQEAQTVSAKPQLVRFCKSDISELCMKSMADGGGAGSSAAGQIIACLRNNLNKLSAVCKRAEFKELELEAKDIRLKSKLFSACRAELKQLCPEVKNDKQLRCLKDNINDKKMRAPCKSQVIIEKRAAARTISAAPAVASACKEDLKRFCSDVKPGQGRTHRCLRKNMDKLGKKCKDAEFKEMADEAEDIMAQPWLKQECKGDLENLCKIKLPENIKGKARSTEGGDESEDAGKLAEKDNGKAKACLKKQHDKKQLLKKCADAVEQEILNESRNIKVDAVLFKACKRGINKLCSGASVGDGNVRFCLFAALVDSPKDLSPMCRVRLSKSMVRESRDWKRNFHVRRHCKEYVQTYCKDRAFSDPATVTNCLADNIKKLTGEGPSKCRASIYSVMRYQLQDARTNMALSRNCKEDFKKFCNGVKPGGGRSRRCLQKQFKKLSKPCQDAEFKTEKYFELAGGVNAAKVVPGAPGAKSVRGNAKITDDDMGEIGSKDVGASSSSSLVLKGPLAMMALTALCLVIIFGIFHFYKKFERNSKTYTVVVNKAG